MEQQYQQKQNEETSLTIQPYAFTFQAHPEYISPTGFNINYINTVQAMEQRGYITHELSRKACEDARTYFDKVCEDSLDVMICIICILLVCRQYILFDLQTTTIRQRISCGSVVVFFIVRKDFLPIATTTFPIHHVLVPTTRIPLHDEYTKY